MRIENAQLEAHDYYPFGQDMFGRSTAGAPVRQGFTGYWRDHEAGLSLYYAGARQYDPTTGRFFGVDPLAEDFPTWSGYTYTLNDPVRWRDPDGRSVCCSNLQASLRFAMNQDRTYLGVLARADSRGNLDAQIKQDAIQVTVTALDRGIHYADAVSTSAGYVAAGSVLLSYPTGGASLTALGPAMTIGFGANVVGLGMTAAKEALVEQSFTSSINRTYVMVTSEAIVKGLGPNVGALVGPLISPAFKLMSTQSDELFPKKDRSLVPADKTRVSQPIEMEP